MISYLYCIYDKVSLSYLPFFESRNDASAIRDFKGSFSGNKLNLDDFDLLCLVRVEKQEKDDGSTLILAIVDEGLRVVNFDRTGVI